MTTSSELKPIVLYDIPCASPGRSWSPNTMKTRYCLGYKQFPFTTVWVELPEIAGLLKSKGITHPPYTLPAIEDPNTGKFIVDSLAIATYLDQAYPETPSVPGPAVRAITDRIGDLSFGSGGGGVAVTGASADGKTKNTRDPTLLVFIVLAGERLNRVSKQYYYETRAAHLGEAWTRVFTPCASSLEERAESVGRGIKALEGLVRKLSALYDGQDGSEAGKLSGPFALGEKPCFVDFAIAGRITFVLDGLATSEAETLGLSGNLSQLAKNLEKYLKY